MISEHSRGWRGHTEGQGDALQALVARGFGGRWLYLDQGKSSGLQFRFIWPCGLSDVVLIFGVDDAEAYRVDDSITGSDPLDIAGGPNLLQGAVGTMDRVIVAVLGWPAPQPAQSATSYFPSTAALDTSPVSDVRHALH